MAGCARQALKIYTKTGDEGQTGLLGGDRVAKTSLRIAAIGDVDELNAHIGLARVGAPEPIAGELAKIQNLLFDLGAELAAPIGGKFDFESIRESQIAWLEASMDRQTNELPPLKAFILPGGTETSARLHVCRSIARRAERTVWSLHEESQVRTNVRVFLNRLSDWLFTTARTANALAHVDDVKWQKTEEITG